MTGTEPETPQPPLAAATDLHKRYGAVAALRGASFDVRPGEVHGLCGHNGAGKSTLMKAMVGLERPDSGTLAVDGEEIALTSVQAAQRAGIAILDQELSVVAELTVAENLFMGNVTEPFWVSDADRNRRATELLDAVGLGGLPPECPVEHTSLGERQLIEVARLLGRDAKVLILDEPTATLTDAEIAFVFASIRRVVAGGAGVVFVSHRLDEVLEICDRVTVLRDGATVATRPVAEMTKDDLVTLMLGEQARSHPRAAGPPAADDRAAGNGLSVRSLRVGDRVAGFDLDIAPGTVVGLAGQLGSGAGDVLAAVAGLAPDVDGTVRVAGRTVRPADPSDALAAGVHYVSDDRKGRGLFGMQSIEANLVSTRLDRHATAGVLRAVGLRRAACRLADLVGIDRRRLGHPVGTLSGGNQQKVFVGRCLDRSDLRVLLLDEPTRGVDVGGRAEIHDLVRRATDDGAAVLFASTELDEVLDLADVVVTLFAGRTVSVRDRATTSSAEVFREMTHRPETAEIGDPA